MHRQGGSARVPLLIELKALDRLAAPRRGQRIMLMISDASTKGRPPPSSYWRTSPHDADDAGQGGLGAVLEGGPGGH